MASGKPGRCSTPAAPRPPHLDLSGISTVLRVDEEGRVVEQSPPNPSSPSEDYEAREGTSSGEEDNLVTGVWGGGRGRTEDCSGPPPTSGVWGGSEGESSGPPPTIGAYRGDGGEDSSNPPPTPFFPGAWGRRQGSERDPSGPLSSSGVVGGGEGDFRAPSAPPRTPFGGSGEGPSRQPPPYQASRFQLRSPWASSTSTSRPMFQPYSPMSPLRFSPIHLSDPPSARSGSPFPFHHPAPSPSTLPATPFPLLEASATTLEGSSEQRHPARSVTFNRGADIFRVYQREASLVRSESSSPPAPLRSPTPSTVEEEVFRRPEVPPPSRSSSPTAPSTPLPSQGRSQVGAATAAKLQAFSERLRSLTSEPSLARTPARPAGRLVPATPRPQATPRPLATPSRPQATPRTPRNRTPDSRATTPRSVTTPGTATNLPDADCYVAVMEGRGTARGEVGIAAVSLAR